MEEWRAEAEAARAAAEGVARQAASLAQRAAALAHLERLPALLQVRPSAAPACAAALISCFRCVGPHERTTRGTIGDEHEMFCFRYCISARPDPFFSKHRVGGASALSPNTPGFVGLRISDQLM